jgi:hypothetical protein
VVVNLDGSCFVYAITVSGDNEGEGGEKAKEESGRGVGEEHTEGT